MTDVARVDSSFFLEMNGLKIYHVNILPIDAILLK